MERVTVASQPGQDWSGRELADRRRAATGGAGP
jgi:hypothetical protein